MLWSGLEPSVPLLATLFTSQSSTGGRIILRPIGFPMYTITWLSPISGDTETWIGKNKLKKSRGLTTNVVKSGKNYYKHVLTFRGELPGSYQLVKHFCKSAIGYTVAYTDIRGKIWTCIITNGSPSFVNSGRDCMYNFTLELEG